MRGDRGFAGEIGHVVVDPSGPRCPCGQVAGAGSATRRARASHDSRARRRSQGRLGSIVSLVGDAEAVRGEDVTHAAAAGDREALAVLEEVGWWLALGLANLIAVLDPSLIVLGGGLVEASSLLLPPTRRQLVGLLEAGEDRPGVEVVAAELGTQAGRDRCRPARRGGLLVRHGVLLPTFRTSPLDALAAADVAVEAGLDGVFAYDHLWPMGSPDRPAIAPFEVLAAVARRQRTLTVGPLVARVGLVDDDVLLGQCRALRVAADGRVVIALGTGDRLSQQENLAYGVALRPGGRAPGVAARVLAATLHDEGVEVWIGDGSPATRAIAGQVGCTLNLWNVAPEDVAAVAASGPVSWAGPAPSEEPGDAATTSLLTAVAGAGATWAVFAPASHVAASSG